jgi:hypothetical protein
LKNLVHNTSLLLYSSLGIRELEFDVYRATSHLNAASYSRKWSLEGDKSSYKDGMPYPFLPPAPIDILLIKVLTETIQVGGK